MLTHQYIQLWAWLEILEGLLQEMFRNSCKIIVYKAASASYLWGWRVITQLQATRIQGPGRRLAENIKMELVR